MLGVSLIWNKLSMNLRQRMREIRLQGNGQVLEEFLRIAGRSKKLCPEKMADIQT